MTSGTVDNARKHTLQARRLRPFVALASARAGIVLGLIAVAIALPAAAAPPRALLIGDHVYRHNVARQAAAMLDKRVELVYSDPGHEQVISSTTAVEHLDDWLGDGKWDLIHFNFGLGDLIHVAPNMTSFRVMPIQSGGVPATDPQTYRKNLEIIVERLKTTGAKLVWANTTPIRHSASKVFRLGMEVEYNAIAAEVMAKHDVPINNMYNHVKAVIDMDKPASHGADPFNFDRKPIHTQLVKTVLSQFGLLKPLEDPVKVVLMVGGWSHVGGGIIMDVNKPRPNQAKGTLDELVLNPETAADYAYLLNDDGAWATRSDVWVQFNRRGDKSGALGIKYGGELLRDVGPELSMGHVLGDHFDEQILLFKTSLSDDLTLTTDLRPPAAGDPGKLYAKLTSQIDEQLQLLADKFPDYNPAKGYEIVALVLNLGNKKDQPEKYAKYLPLLLSDLRQELGKPALPTIIVGTGLGGHDATDFPELIKAQQAVAASPQFKDSVAYVETRDFWPPANARDAYRHAKHDQWYHNAKSFIDMGQAIANALIKLAP